MESYRPRDYQTIITHEIMHRRRYGVFAAMGLGKTAATLDAIYQLMYKYFNVSRVLVIAPKRVAEDVWSDEVDKWKQFSRMSVSVIAGTEKQRNAAVEVDADIYTVSRDNIAWLIRSGVKWKWDMLVVDESSSFKNHASKRFKALKVVSPLCDRIILLTGTPAPKGYLNLWSQIYLLDRGQRLGRNITAYREAYFFRREFQWYIAPGCAKLIESQLKDICVGLDNKEFLKLKEPLFNIVKIKMSSSLKKTYEKFKEDMVLEFFDERGEIIADTKAILINKLLQFASGAIYNAKGNTEFIHDLKIEALRDIVEEAQGEPIMVFYNYKHEFERIKKEFPNVKTLDKQSDRRSWNAGEYELVACHPASVGHGLNLQNGGHIIVWFSLSWDLEAYDQANARLARPGQKSDVIIHQLIIPGTADMAVLNRLRGKSDNQQKFLQEIKYVVKGT